MVLLYARDLKILQSNMMEELRKIGLSHIDEKHTEVSEMIIKFESLLKAAVICLNHERRFLNLYWKKTYRGVNLHVVCQKSDKSESLLEEVVQLVDFTDWITEYKWKLRDFIRKAHQDALSQVDSKRDDAIESNALEWDNNQEQFMAKPANKSDEVLGKSKQVSANLIKSNQILQAGVLQSDLNLDELRQQTSSLSQMNDKYSQLGLVFDRTSQLMKTLEKASHREKRDVYLSLGFLSLCIAYVLWRRIFKLPCKLAIWILFRFFKTILITIGLVSRHTSTALHTTGDATVAIATSTSISGKVLSLHTESLEHAVDQAMDRIISHDEL